MRRSLSAFCSASLIAISRSFGELFSSSVDSLSLVEVSFEVDSSLMPTTSIVVARFVVSELLPPTRTVVVLLPFEELVESEIATNVVVGGDFLSTVALELSGET
jgi:hypothetical protein